MKGMKPILFWIQGEEPYEAEIKRLSILSFDRGLPGEAEIKDALKWFVVGVLVGIAVFLFGRWVIRKFSGPGVLMFGYGAAYLAAPFSVIFGFVSLFKLLRPAHKTKASAALEWAWMTSILGEDATGERFGKPAYAVSTMRRLLPTGTDFEATAFEDYVGKLRAAMAEAADETAAEYKKSGWHESGPSKSCKIDEETELSPNLAKVSATITYRDQVAMTGNNNKTRYTMSAMLELHITQYYIRSGKYWFPYDIMPSFLRDE